MIEAGVSAMFAAKLIKTCQKMPYNDRNEEEYGGCIKRGHYAVIIARRKEQ